MGWYAEYAERHGNDDAEGRLRDYFADVGQRLCQTAAEVTISSSDEWLKLVFLDDDELAPAVADIADLERPQLHRAMPADFECIASNGRVTVAC
jgi:hypothetical protein